MHVRDTPVYKVIQFIE